MLDIIKKCHEKNKVVSLYFNKDDNSRHQTGFIAWYNNNEILIKHISDRGLYDGFIVNKFEDLYRISYDDKYENKVLKLYKIKNQSHPEIDIKDNNVLFSLFDYSMKNNCLCKLELANDDIVGIITNYNEEYIYIHEIDYYGEKAGICVINYDEIITICCDTDNEQDLMILYSKKLNK